MTFITALQLLCPPSPTLPFCITLKHQRVRPICISICIFRNQRQIYLQRKRFLPEIFPYFVQDWCPTEGCGRSSSSCPRGWVCLVFSLLPLSLTLCKKAFPLYRRDNSQPSRKGKNFLKVLRLIEDQGVTEAGQSPFWAIFSKSLVISFVEMWLVLQR